MSYFDDHEDDLVYGPKFRFMEDDGPREPRCKHCGSTDVRWRQQGSRWVLFSMQPGVEHTCAADDLAKDFD